MEVTFLGHVISRTGLACDPDKLSAVWAWHPPDSVMQVRQFVGFIGYYCRLIPNFAGVLESLVALTCKGTVFAWTKKCRLCLTSLKSCLLRAPILGFPIESDRFVLDTDACLFAVGGVLNKIQCDQEVVIAYARRSLRLSQRRYCTTRQEMCIHFRSYLHGAQFTLGTDHRSLRWLQKFRNSDGMLA